MEKQKPQDVKSTFTISPFGSPSIQDYSLLPESMMIPFADAIQHKEPDHERE